MSRKVHHYRTGLRWVGNQGTGTSGYRAYSRNHELSAAGKADIAGSSDPSFRGDPARWNPEELLVASLSACHQLWYLHLCAEAGIVITDYRDNAIGEMVEDANGGHFTAVTLHPQVTISAGDPAQAAALHYDAHARCFVANSVNFPVGCEPEIMLAAAAP